MFLTFNECILIFHEYTARFKLFSMSTLNVQKLEQLLITGIYFNQFHEYRHNHC